MAKLDERKVKWILREMEKGTSVSRIAWAQKVSRQWVNALYRRYRETGRLPVPRKAGRRPTPPSEEDVDLVLRYAERYGMGACGLELAMARDGVRVPHNRIHDILKGRGLASPDPKKQGRRRYVRYERPHSMDLWHTDWYMHAEEEWWVVYEDDASRLVTATATDRVPTMDTTIVAFDAAVGAWGVPRQVLSDHGSTFWANPYEGVVRGPSRFTGHLEGMGVDHILSRVGRPEGNGKVERTFQTLERLRPRFDSLEATVRWYNESWPHMSLDGAAPLQAFYWKLPPERIMGFANSWFWSEASLNGN
jgi:putative transposase